MAHEILTERDGDIVTVILNRPERRNALNLAGWVALAETFRDLDTDDTIRCVVVRGAGREAFAAGADISAFAAERGDVEQATQYGRSEMAGILAVFGSRHPTVALIEGVCVGGGLEIACGCDIRVCGESSRFGVPINRLGLTMAYDEIEFFMKAVGRSVAMELLLEGSIVGASRARELGLVTRVVDDEAVEREAYAAAHRVAEGAPLVNRWHKEFANRLALGTPLSVEEVARGYAAFGTEDYGIGYRAFLAKQKPQFKGR